MSAARYEPVFWEAGEEHDDATRKLVDEEVHNALAEYIGDGCLSISYRKGGTPVVNFSVETRDFDLVPGGSHERDLGNVLLAALNQFSDGGPEQMVDLLRAMLEAYNSWRMQRAASDPDCDIPAPVDESVHSE